MGATNLLFEVKVDRAVKGSRNAARVLHEQLKAAIVEGRLAVGAKLPATRHSEAVFGVSRNTVVEVYDRLLDGGYVVSRRGSGTFVADRAPQLSLAGPREKAFVEHRLNPFWLQADVASAMNFWRDSPASTTRDSSATAIDFRPALVDPRHFPYDVLRRVSTRQMRNLERKPAGLKSPQGNQGNHALRSAIVGHIALTRGVACRPDDVLVTCGAQQAFDLLAKTLVIPGETIVAIEDPGYPPMRVPFAALGARVVPVPVDHEGLMIEHLPPDVGVICVTPSHQFPLGMSMSPRRRQELVVFARAHGAVIIEDDYDGEFRYDGSPLEALRTAAAADVVFYVGTFSKCMLPSLRLGFVVAPEWAMRTLVAAKNALDWHCSVPIQLGVAAFIDEGHLARHVRRMRGLYRQRRQLLLEQLEGDLGEWLEPIPSFYGMHVAALARSNTDLDRVSETLLQRNLKIHTLGRYYAGPPTRAGLIFGYGVVDSSEIKTGLAWLRKTLAR
jgi:GntR family transcriptional regulator/MocR family aminotransferase